jgi:hypothetical protein
MAERRLRPYVTGTTRRVLLAALAAGAATPALAQSIPAP